MHRPTLVLALALTIVTACGGNQAGKGKPMGELGSAQPADDPLIPIVEAPPTFPPEQWSRDTILFAVQSGRVMEIDFLEVRAQYVLWDGYDPYDPNGRQERDFLLYSPEDVGYEEACRRGMELVEDRWGDLVMWATAIVPCFELDPVAHLNYAIVMSQLRDAILMQRGQDGSSAERAYRVVSVEEEYYLCHFLFNLDVVSQALVRENGRQYDVLETRNPDGTPGPDLWFDVTPLFDHIGRQFGGDDVSGGSI